ncbi:mannose-6-phosphate isomerase, class I [Vibrio cholerae]|uniref:mannose-6-phosphate isomerase, class I n=1 Tax=Vibrio cholerae TaxID=666 RepID=UPI0011D5D67D|nr:mannose-6-phosphate isomerase, class I [Vibrio cholerae]EGR2537669.1 mannose-6-phosphate isomerase, class I [Vibrio cholerae]EJL6293315.1 mannose-6-phosphate isomerase, class I [Vibrio cholerae]EKI0759075.1 mannose-6-phosphate isomerase, class I [Vibrio cholerae]TXZ65733.1 mannose-6-phosphate isomerase, class I [Vibrio cholerae]BCN20538.1 mannose-6-phosphate isomerase [Vibrio cholerae]
MTKNYLFKLENTIQNYAWGSKTALQWLFGIENLTQQPQAEIWMGAHPNGCSKVQYSDGVYLLSDLIDADKPGILSPRTAQEFGELPYLFKILAADSALSIQVHPDKVSAELGFAKEEALGIDRCHPQRNYRDSNHKPELVYALTPYQAMNGFRRFSEIIAFFEPLVTKSHLPKVAALLEQFCANKTSAGLEVFFVGILSLSGDDKMQALKALLTYAYQQLLNQDKRIEFALILELAQSYPSDIGLFAPLMLNVLTLRPGEAMYLDARTPHAYLKGVGLEVMASSDNVLRAGLTTKHIDVTELARCTLFSEKPKETLLLEPVVEGNKQSYSVPVPDFAFDCFLKAEAEHIYVESAEIVLSIDADTTVSHLSGETLLLKKGESAFIPAFAKEYIITSTGRVARVFN